VSVKLLKRAFVLGVLGLWLGAANHCLLEHLPGFEFLVCAPHGETGPHQDTGCNTDVCATVEKATYKTERAEAKVPTLVLILAAFLPSPGLDTAAAQLPLERLIESAPELSVTWQFTFRAALPPRAPSLLS